MKGSYVDFKHLKASVPITAVLDHYGVRLRRNGPRSLRGHCPLPTHTSQRSTNSFCVDTDLNVWACQSASCSQARGGRLGGTILDLVAAMEGSSIREAGEKLAAWSSSSGQNRQSMSRPAQLQPEPNEPLPFVLKDLDPTHPYIRKRGITEETARTFGIGFYGGSGFLGGRVVIPIHNSTGQLVAYAGRSVDRRSPKYRFPRGFRKSSELFNFHRTLEVSTDVVILVEGFFDCMKVYQAGFPSVIGLMGSSLSRVQERILRSHFKNFVLLMDGDRAGREATRECLRGLFPDVVSAVSLGDSRQPDEMTSLELQLLLRCNQCDPAR